MEYDPHTCVTAGELRKIGMHIPDSIPDCAWVPRWSFEPGEVECGEPDGDQGRVDMRVTMRFNMPFQWVEGRFQVEE